MRERQGRVERGGMWPKRWNVAKAVARDKGVGQTM